MASVQDACVAGSYIGRPRALGSAFTQSSSSNSACFRSGGLT